MSESRVSQFSIPSPRGRIPGAFGVKAHQDCKKCRAVLYHTTVPAIIQGRNEREAISRKEIMSWNLVSFHYSSLLDFLSCKKRKVSTSWGLWRSWKLIGSTLSSSISFCPSSISLAIAFAMTIQIVKLFLQFCCGSDGRLVPL